jgi:uncharacterized membrane protein YkvA (DUF1232 family)
MRASYKPRTGRRRWFRQEVLALYFAVSDRRTPLRVKLLVFFALFYLVDPIDLIPDVIPVAGYLDDLIIVPLLLHLAFRWLPPAVREESLVKAERQAKRVRLVLIALVFLLLGMLVGMFFLGKAVAEHFR